MHTSQIISLAFALAGAMAAPAPQSTGTVTASSAKGPKVSGSPNLYYCKDPSEYPFQVTDVTITPKIPAPGKNVTVEIKGTLSEEVTQGTQQKTTFGKIENGQEKILFSTTRDVCSGLDLLPADVGVKKCPIAAGPFDWTHSHAIPDFPKKFDSSKISPEKLTAAKEKIDAFHAKVQDRLPAGDFFFRGQIVDAQEKVLSCVYADLNKDNLSKFNGTLPPFSV